MFSIVIGGDVYPGAASTPHLKRGDIGAVFNGLAEVLQAGDLRLANLEGPLINQRTPIAKIGPTHAIDEGCVVGLKAAGFEVLNLGNNHIMDQGARGLETTMRLCDQHGIAHLGAGKNIEAASQPLICEVKGERVAFLSYVEHEFGMATPTAAGANPWDLIQFVRTVTARRREWDHLIVLVHGGNEYYPYPRPDLQEICRFMVEQGAGAVICQHSHCAGSWEEYQGAPIIYGQGNLVFDERSSKSCEQEGFLAVLETGAGKGFKLRLEPFFQETGKAGPVLQSARAAQFLRDLEMRSHAIRQPGYVQEQWENYCRANSERYLGLIQGHSRKVRELDKRFHFLRLFRSRDRMRMLLHLLRCESHREVLIHSLTDFTK